MKMTGIPILGIPFFGHIPIFVHPYLFHYYYPQYIFIQKYNNVTIILKSYKPIRL